MFVVGFFTTVSSRAGSIASLVCKTLDSIAGIETENSVAITG
jgi:hypothetical protein